jgi:hypothetical protein
MCLFNIWCIRIMYLRVCIIYIYIWCEIVEIHACNRNSCMTIYLCTYNIHAYIYTRIYTRIYLYTYIFTYIHTYIEINVHTSLCICDMFYVYHVCMHIYISVCVCVRMHLPNEAFAELHPIFPLYVCMYVCKNQVLGRTHTKKLYMCVHAKLFNIYCRHIQHGFVYAYICVCIHLCMHACVHGFHRVVYNICIDTYFIFNAAVFWLVVGTKWQRQPFDSPLEQSDNGSRLTCRWNKVTTAAVSEVTSRKMMGIREKLAPWQPQNNDHFCV